MFVSDEASRTSEVEQPSRFELETYGFLRAEETHSHDASCPTTAVAMMVPTDAG